MVVCRPEELKIDISCQSIRGMEPGKGHGSPTLNNRKPSWGLPGLWIGSKQHLPKLTESDDENAESHVHANSEFSKEMSNKPIYILSVQQETKEDSPVVVMSETKQKDAKEVSPKITMDGLNQEINESTPAMVMSESKEAPELTTPASQQFDMVPHGSLEGGMRRNAQSFDESMLGFVSEMPIPHDYMKQNKGFVSSLYGSLSELSIGKKSTSSQPSSAESSRCSSPTGSITDRVKESGFTASPVKMQKRFGRLFRDINATTPSQW